MSLPWRPQLVAYPHDSLKILDQLSAAPKAVWWVSEVLLKAYAGPLIRIRRASDNAQQDIGFVAATGKLDTAAIATFCGASNGFIRVIYDQSGGGFNYTQATAAQQVKIYDSGTGVVLIGSSAAALSDGVNDGFTGTDTLGITGVGQAISYWTRVLPSAVAAAQTPMAVGHYVLDEGLYFYYSTTTLIHADMGPAGNRQFTASNLTAQVNNLALVLGAGTQVGTIACYQNGAALAEASVTNPTTTLDMQGANRSLYRDDGTAASVNGKMQGGIVWNAALTATDLFKLNAYTW